MHGGRRLRPGDERRDDHRARAGDDLPGRTAAAEGGNRRGRDCRGAGRRRRAYAAFRGRRPPRRGRRPCDRVGARDRRHVARFQPATVDGAADRAADGRSGRALRRGSDRRPLELRRARGDRADRRWQPLSRIQGALRGDAGLRLRSHPRAPGGDPREQRRAVLAERPEGRTLHRAVRSPSGAARVPAEHQRLHGGPRLRTRRHREGRREARDGGQLRSRAEADGDRRRLVRRRQLRHVRSRVRPALPVDVAQRTNQRDGRRASSHGALDDPLRPARGAWGAVARS